MRGARPLPDELRPRGPQRAPAGAAQKAGGGVEVLGGNAPREHADNGNDHDSGKDDVEDEGDGHFGLRFGGKVLIAIGMVGPPGMAARPQEERWLGVGAV